MKAPKAENNLCPFAKIVSLECDTMYRLDEFYRQMETALQSGKSNYTYITKDTQCTCNPEQCQRYTQHMIANMSKYTQKQK